MAPGPEAQRSNAPTQATRAATQNTQRDEQIKQLDQTAANLLQFEYENSFLKAAKRENPEVSKNLETLTANLQKQLGGLKPPLSDAQRTALDQRLGDEILSARFNGEKAWKTSLSDAQEIYNALNGGLFGRNDEPKVISILANKTPGEFANISMAYEHYVKTYAGKWTSSDLNLATELRDELSSDAQIRLQRLLSPESQHKSLAQMQAERIHSATESNTLFSRISGYNQAESILATYRDAAQHDQNGAIVKSATAKQVGDVEKAYRTLTGNDVSFAVTQLNVREQKLVQAYRNGDGTEIASRELEVTLKVPSQAAPDEKGNYVAAQNQNVVDRKAFFLNLEALANSGTENLNRVSKLFEAHVGKSIQTVANETWGEGSVLANRTAELLEGQIISSRASAFQAGRRSYLMTLFGDKEEVKSVVSPFRSDNDTLAMAIAFRTDQGFQNDVKASLKVDANARVTDAQFGQLVQKADAGDADSKQLVSRAHAIFAKQRSATISNGDEEWEYKVALRGQPTTTEESVLRARLYQDRYGNRFGATGEKRYVQDQYADLVTTAQDLQKTPDNQFLHQRTQVAADVFTSGSRSMAENERNFSGDVKKAIPMGVGAVGATALTLSGVGSPLGIALFAAGTGGVTYGGMKTADYLLSSDDSVRLGNLSDITASAEAAVMVGGIGALGQLATTSRYVQWASEVSPIAKSPVGNVAGARVVGAGDGALQGILIGAPAGALVGGTHSFGQALVDPDIANAGYFEAAKSIGIRTLSGAGNGAVTGAAFGATGGAIYRFARPVSVNVAASAPSASTLAPLDEGAAGLAETPQAGAAAMTGTPITTPPPAAPAPAASGAPLSGAPTAANTPVGNAVAPAPEGTIAFPSQTRVSTTVAPRATSANPGSTTTTSTPPGGVAGGESAGGSNAALTTDLPLHPSPSPVVTQEGAALQPGNGSGLHLVSRRSSPAVAQQGSSSAPPVVETPAVVTPEPPVATTSPSPSPASVPGREAAAAVAAPVNQGPTQLDLLEGLSITATQEKTVAQIVEKYRRSFFPLQSEVSTTGTITAEFRTPLDFVKYVQKNHPELQDAITVVLADRVPQWERLASQAITAAATEPAEVTPGMVRQVLNGVSRYARDTSAQAAALGAGVILPLSSGIVALSQLRGSDNTGIPLNPGFGFGEIIPTNGASPDQVLAQVAAATPPPSAGAGDAPAAGTDGAAPAPEPARPTVAFGSIIQDVARANNVSQAILVSIMAQHYALENKQLDLNAAVDPSALTQVQATAKGIKEDIEKNQPSLAASLSNPASEKVAKDIFITYFSNTSRDAAGNLMPQSLLEYVGPTGRDALVLQALETYKAVQAGGGQVAPADVPHAQRTVEQPPVVTASSTPVVGDSQPVTQLSQASLPPAPAPAQLAVASAEAAATRAAESNTEAVENIVRQSYVPQGRNNPFRNLFTEQLRTPFTPARELSFDPAFRRTESFGIPSTGNLSLNLTRGVTLGALQSPRNGLGSGMNVRFMPAQSAVVAETDEV